MADRLGKAIVRAKARHVVEGQFGAGGDHRTVVGHRLAIDQFDAVFARMQTFGGHRDKVDRFLGQDGCQIDGGLVTLALIHGNPWIGGHEVINRVFGHHGNRVFLAKFIFQFVGHVGTAQPSRQYNDMRHDCLLD
jgi:hypothetical protein